MYKYLFWGLILILATFIAWYFWATRAGVGLDLIIVAPDKVSVGVPFAVKIGVANNGQGVLDDVRVNLALPEGMALAGFPVSKSSDMKNVGKIGAGSVVDSEFQLIIMAGDIATSTKNLTVSASYLPEGVSSRFEKSQTFGVTATDFGLSLEVGAPEKVFGGEDFTLDVSYKNISDIDLRGLRLAFEYPAGFEFKKATLAPDASKNFWQLGDLRRGSEMKFKIFGNLVGPESSAFNFRARVSAEFNGQSYFVGDRLAQTSIVASPISLSINLANQDSLVAAPGDELRYYLTFTNTTDQAFRDVIIAATLDGIMFDWRTLNSQSSADWGPLVEPTILSGRGGAVSAFGNSIIWNSLTNPRLALLAPHAVGAVGFSIKTLNGYPIKRLSDKNFVLKVSGRLEAAGTTSNAAGVETATNGQLEKITSAAQLETKVRGAVTMTSHAFFRDAAAGLVNKGPWPPKVGQPTEYTIHWAIANFSNDISGVNLSASLPTGVRCTGVSQTSAPTGGACNDSTHLVSWSIDKIPATRGVVDKPVELIFQIEATPSADSAGKYLPLIGETRLTAKDDFTGADLEFTAGAITTALPDDLTIGVGSGMVAQ